MPIFVDQTMGVAIIATLKYIPISMEEYIVSARKYRPMSFDSVVGQSALTTTLKNAVKSGKLAHAYLFCGPRGVGKTTCARIFAKAINCMHPTAEGEACNECESCQAFNEQRSYNIFELDAASNNSVENIKALMEQTRIAPQLGRYKVFIIDEVHMLSTPSSRRSRNRQPTSSSSSPPPRSTRYCPPSSAVARFMTSTA